MAPPFKRPVISRAAVQTVSLLPRGVHMAAFAPYDQAVIRTEPDLKQRLCRESPVPSIIESMSGKGGSILIVYGQKRRVCTIVNISTRIVQECPTAIHSVEV